METLGDSVAGPRRKEVSCIYRELKMFFLYNLISISLTAVFTTTTTGGEMTTWKKDQI